MPQSKNFSDFAQGRIHACRAKPQIFLRKKLFIVGFAAGIGSHKIKNVTMRGLTPKWLLDLVPGGGVVLAGARYGDVG
jgi:hypothetical protein